jgi:hypothetical protein
MAMQHLGQQNWQWPCPVALLGADEFLGAEGGGWRGDSSRGREPTAAKCGQGMGPKARQEHWWAHISKRLSLSTLHRRGRGVVSREEEAK